MAEKALKKVEDQLNCSICLDTYTDPKLLQCFHVYCQGCLMRLVLPDQQGQLFITCPNCRQVTPIPAKGVAGLQPAFHINHLLDIAEDLKKENGTLTSTDSSSASLPPPRERISGLCSEHVEEELKLYCETCGELICFHCALKTGKHHSHDYTLLEEAFESYKKEIGSSLEPIKKQLAAVHEALALFDRRNGEISDQRAAVEADIHDTIRQLYQVLDMRRTELISRLHQMTQRKLKDLAAQRDQVEVIHAQLSSCLDFMEKSIRADSQSEALKMKTTVVKQVKELTTTIQPDILKPNTEADIVFSASDDLSDLTALCRSFGQVSTPGSPDPSKCHATGKGLEVANVGQTSTAVLQVLNCKGEPCKPVTSLEYKLVSEITGAKATGSSERKGQNQYEISYQPTIKGRHQLHISIEGQHIRGSPFNVTVTSSVHNLGTPMHVIHGVDWPWGVAINHKGEIVVSERGTHDGNVSVYSPSGKKVRTISGITGGLFGLTLDREGNILVGDDTNNSVRKYSPEGQLLASVGTKGSGQLQFDDPEDIAVNTSNNKVYVVDSGNDRIQVLNSDLTFSATFGKEGQNKGQFDNPTGVACDSAGNVYVTDGANHRIQVFTAKGKFLRMFGRGGEGGGELNRPIGIALDPSNNHVYVSEMTNHRISVFTCEGQFVTSFGVTVEGFDPRGLAVDNSGVVYVCDFGVNSCIQIL